MISVKEFSSVLLDLDGVVYRGEHLIPGVMDFFKWLNIHRMDYALITNNSTLTPEQITTKLIHLGLNVSTERILTSALATAQYIRTRANPGTRIYPIGETGLHDALLSYGFEITEDDPEYVVVGLDRTFHIDKLEIAVKAIRNGARFIATNSDPNLATEKGLEPGTGTLVAMVANETNIEPIVIGKPAPWLFEAAIKRLQKPPSKIVMIGDNLETDIQGAQAIGMKTVLVLTGITTQANLVESSVAPDIVVNALTELVALWSF